MTNVFDTRYERVPSVYIAKGEGRTDDPNYKDSPEALVWRASAVYEATDTFTGRLVASAVIEIQPESRPAMAVARFALNQVSKSLQP